MSGPTAVFLISCRDRKGLVAEVSSFIFRHDGNIVHAEQHIDVPQGIFFHRIEWELDGFRLGAEEIRASFKQVADRFDMQWSLSFSSIRRKMAIFASRHDHCLLDLLYRHRIGELPAEVVAVISNHPDLKAMADFYGIPFWVFPITSQNKTDQERRELELLAELQVDLVVLARYMQILSPRFVDAYPSRIINIHHSFLPAFVGGKPYDQAYGRGVKLVGATAHYVTEELDEGPIISQDVVRISHRDSVEDLVAKGRDVERQVLGHAVRLHLLDRVLPYQKKTVVFT